MSDTVWCREAVDIRLAEARKGLARGWALTPQRGKRCFRTGWQSEPPAALAMVERWARAGNLALRTGSVSGIVVLDDDSPAQNASVLLDLPQTPTVETGSGRRHHYFRQPDFRVRNSTGLLLPGVDVKGEAGAATFVGSTHPDSQRVYRWKPGLSPEDVPLRDLPDAVQSRLRPAPHQPRVFTLPAVNGGDRVQRYAAGALRGAALRVFDAREGARNSTLNREAFALARFVAAGLLARARVEDVLADAARSAGLADAEIAATLRSALESGLRDPRSLLCPEVHP